nr:MAG TPA: hypothetical protein [Caudoviricetes sp.]
MTYNAHRCIIKTVKGSTQPQEGRTGGRNGIFS